MSLLPRSVEKRSRRLRLEIEIEWHSKCNRLHKEKQQHTKRSSNIQKKQYTKRSSNIHRMIERGRKGVVVMTWYARSLAVYFFRPAVHSFLPSAFARSHYRVLHSFPPFPPPLLSFSTPLLLSLWLWLWLWLSLDAGLLALLACSLPYACTRILWVHCVFGCLSLFISCSFSCSFARDILRDGSHLGKEHGAPRKRCHHFSITGRISWLA